jgi:hypothetical protein
MVLFLNSWLTTPHGNIRLSLPLQPPPILSPSSPTPPIAALPEVSMVLWQ